MNKTKLAAEAVRQIIKDLSDRRGLGQEWAAIDDEIQKEIEVAWRQIIGACFKRKKNP